jgi:translation initiation factor IF-3
VRPIKKGYLRVNEQIRAREVRLINHEGKQVGIIPLEEARRQAEQVEMDLVEVAPDANPPVCKIIDYRKVVYEARRKEREARKHRRHVEIKEVKMRPTIDPHDYETKMRRIKEFLGDGHKVKVTIMFRGREITHSERGRDLMMRVATGVAEIGAMEDRMVQVGRQQHMVLAPVPAAKQEKKAAPESAPEGASS